MERFVLVVVVTARKLMPYFSDTLDIGKNRLPYTPSPLEAISSRKNGILGNRVV